MAVRRLRPRWRAGRCGVLADRLSQAERCRSARLARQRVGAHCRSSSVAPPRTFALALAEAIPGPQPGSMTAAKARTLIGRHFAPNLSMPAAMPASRPTVKAPANTGPTVLGGWIRKTMKITRIDDLHADAGWRNFSFLRIETSDGIVGWSE